MHRFFIFITLISSLSCAMETAAPTAPLAIINADICSICQDPFTRIQPDRIFSCKHGMHLSCYEDFSAHHEKEHKNIDCPLCRKRIKTNELTAPKDNVLATLLFLRSSTYQTIQNQNMQPAVKNLLSDFAALYDHIGLNSISLVAINRINTLNLLVGTFIETMPLVDNAPKILAERNSLEKELIHLVTFSPG